MTISNEPAWKRFDLKVRTKRAADYDATKSSLETERLPGGMQ